MDDAGEPGCWKCRKNQPPAGKGKYDQLIGEVQLDTDKEFS
jgi:hypothetical protein